MQPDANAPSHRLARVAAHLRPQMEEGAVAFALRPAVCRAKGGAPGFKVAILGAAGGIGQPLSLLMKMNPLVSVLHLYDVVNTPGVTADISHMDTSAVVTFSPPLPPHPHLIRGTVLSGVMATTSAMH
jgi:malate dehydrogenase